MPNAADIARALQIGAAPMALPTTNTDIARALNNHNWYVPDPRPSRKGKWMKVEKG